MSFWILQSNPNVFRLPESGFAHECAVGEEDWWGISKYYKVVEPGETAYIWQSIDYRPSTGPLPRGIYAKATVISVPFRHTQEALTIIDKLQKVDSGMWQNRRAEAHQKQKPILLIKYIANVSPPLTAEELVSAGLGTIGVLRFTHADIYKLSEDDAKQIERILEGRLVT